MTKTPCFKVFHPFSSTLSTTLYDTTNYFTFQLISTRLKHTLGTFGVLALTQMSILPYLEMGATPGNTNSAINGKITFRGKGKLVILKSINRFLLKLSSFESFLNFTNCLFIFSVDTFNIETPSIGNLKRVRIGHDNKGLAAGWFLDKVKPF